MDKLATFMVVHGNTQNAGAPFVLWVKSLDSQGLYCWPCPPPLTVTSRGKVLQAPGRSPGGCAEAAESRGGVTQNLSSSHLGMLSVFPKFLVIVEMRRPAAVSPPPTTGW